MTLAPEAPHTLQEVAVRFSSDGTPLAVRHDGRIWAVDPDVHAAHWFARDAWWDTRRSAPLGVGNVVDIEFWRVQVRANDTALRTFTLRLAPLSTQWQLESITDDE